MGSVKRVLIGRDEDSLWVFVAGRGREAALRVKYLLGVLTSIESPEVSMLGIEGRRLEDGLREVSLGFGSDECLGLDEKEVGELKLGESSERF